MILCQKNLNIFRIEQMKQINEMKNFVAKLVKEMKSKVDVLDSLIDF